MQNIAINNIHEIFDNDMIPKEKIKLCAENIVKGINIKKENEFILIKGGLYCYDLLDEIGVSVLRKGGNPHISPISDYYENSMWQDDQIKAKTIKSTPLPYLEMIKKIDAYIVIEYPEDPLVRNRAPKDKLEAYQEGRASLNDILYGYKEEYAPGKRWIYSCWPSEKMANYYKIEYDLLEKFIINGMCIPSEDLTKITENIGKFFEKAKKVYVSDDYGTDFWVSIENRDKILDDGLISEEQIALGDLGGNLPAGEVFFPPHEKQGEGTLFCPLTIERYTHKILKNVELSFKDGKLLIDKVSADINLDLLIDAFKQSEKVDRENNVPEIRTYNVGELGIGCNPVITKAIGYILTDEKINGSVHVAFGSNKGFGGTSASQMHWDFVTSPKANITVEYIDGSKKSIMENGKLIEE
ncbi:MAG: aminopeptidase [Promethearchaeota archaeon]